LLYELLHTCLTEAEKARGRFGLIRYMLLAQLMWLWMSRSTYIALLEMITGRRSWHKTPHGHAERDDDDEDFSPYRGGREPAASLAQESPQSWSRSYPHVPDLYSVDGRR
jgi:hypothetical protein